MLKSLPPKLCVRLEPLHTPRLEPIAQALPLAHPCLNLCRLLELRVSRGIRFGRFVGDLLEDGHVLGE